MEFVREFVPFMVGAAISPAVTFVGRRLSRTRPGFWSLLTIALVIGTLVSFLAGEWAGGTAEALAAVMIDASLAFTGSQLMYRLPGLRSAVARAERAEPVVTRP